MLYATKFVPERKSRLREKTRRRLIKVFIKCGVKLNDSVFIVGVKFLSFRINNDKELFL